MDAVKLRELLARKRRAEVRIALADDANHLHPKCRRIGPVARLPAAARHQCSRAVLPKYLAQPKHLATAKPHQRHCLRNPDPLLCQIAQNVHPIDLRTAHQNHRHRPPAPHPIRKPGRVTSLSGPTVTSLSGVYILDSHKRYYGTSLCGRMAAWFVARRRCATSHSASVQRLMPQRRANKPHTLFKIGRQASESARESTLSTGGRRAFAQIQKRP